MSHTERAMCIHGHFYQPPREDPWLGRILVEPSAAPMLHWNERIVAESYRPVGWAHRVQDGRIVDIVNCYSWMSFNAGPTLMSWLERRAPDVHDRILEADAESLARWGHGNAMAQVYHHAIMPLCSPLDRELEAAWAVADFERRFGRSPEGMWLAESAVDTPSLEVLAAQGIRFVILAPRQAKAVAPPDGDFAPVDEGSLDCSRPYRVDLPSGRDMAVFFYHGALSQAVAFERLLENGDAFWNRLNGAASGGLLLLATDGETYGHHFPFGEMALAHVLANGRGGRDGLALTNPAAYLADNPPVWRAALHEPSSWSCVHGVERWRSDCGCTDGGHPDWNQAWRGPLREALTKAKSGLDNVFFRQGREVFRDPRAALLDYGQVLADPSRSAEYAARHVLPSIKQNGADRGWQLLAMQERALAAFASCAWFFDDVSRIEPVNAMTFMLRAIELGRDAGGPDLEGEFLADLGKARSNKPEEGTGADVFRQRVLPKRQDRASLCLLAVILASLEGGLVATGEEHDLVWPGFSLRLRLEARQEGEIPSMSGKARLGTPLESGDEWFDWTWHAPGPERQSVTPVTDASSVTVTLADGTSQTRSFGQMPRHVRDYVSFRALAAGELQVLPRALSTASVLLSLFAPWEEGQSTMPNDHDWAALSPYLLAQCVLDQSVSDRQRQRVADFCASLGTTPLLRRKTARIVEAELLKGLSEDSPAWLLLAGVVTRAGQYLPEMNLWSARNLFAGHPGAGADRAILGEALGFNAKP